MKMSLFSICSVLLFVSAMICDPLLADKVDPPVGAGAGAPGAGAGAATAGSSSSSGSSSEETKKGTLIIDEPSGGQPKPLSIKTYEQVQDTREWRGGYYDFVFALDKTHPSPIKISFLGKTFDMNPGQTRTVRMSRIVGSTFVPVEKDRFRQKDGVWSYSFAP
jgi:hypothetical protein